jgi:hypothetical protein
LRSFYSSYFKVKCDTIIQITEVLVIRQYRPLREYVFEYSPVHVVLRAGIELTEFR